MIGHLPSAHASGTYLVLRCFALHPDRISGTIISGLGAAGNRKIGVVILAIINSCTFRCCSCSRSAGSRTIRSASSERAFLRCSPRR